MSDNNSDNNPCDYCIVVNMLKERIEKLEHEIHDLIAESEGRYEELKEKDARISDLENAMTNASSEFQWIIERAQLGRSELVNNL